MIEQLLQYLVLEANIPEVEEQFTPDEVPDSLEDYILEENPADESLIDITPKYQGVLYIQEELVDIIDYEISESTEDYSSYYVMDEIENEDVDEMRLDLEYIMSLNDGLDADEQIFIFWQRYIAKLPKHLWYMSY